MREISPAIQTAQNVLHWINKWKKMIKIYSRFGCVYCDLFLFIYYSTEKTFINSLCNYFFIQCFIFRIWWWRFERIHFLRLISASFCRYLIELAWFGMHFSKNQFENSYCKLINEAWILNSDSPYCLVWNLPFVGNN